MVGFPDAVKLGFQRFTDFRGRSTRAEYWWWVLFVVVVGAILSFVDIRTGTYNTQSGSGLLSGLFKLATLTPGLALGARRLHDINRTGWWQLMWFGILLSSVLAALKAPRFALGGVGPVIVLLWWATKPSDEGTNKYGLAPRHHTSQ